MNANQNGSLGSDRLSKYESIQRPHGRKIWIIPFCRAAVAGLAKSEIILNSKIGTLYICTIQYQWKILPEKYKKKTTCWMNTKSHLTEGFELGGVDTIELVFLRP